MEPVYLPRIQRDFPELNLEELKKKAEPTLLSVFTALSSAEEGLLSGDAGKEIREKVGNLLAEL